MSENAYWQSRFLSRRAALRAAAAGGGGLVALSLVGCSGDDEGKSAAGDSDQQPSQQDTDPKKGVQGGKFVTQHNSDWGSIVLARARNAGSNTGASFTHSGLYQMRNGRPGVALNEISVEFDLATAFPETPADQVTWIVKIQPGTKFQNGRVVTAEDVKYSYERYAFAPDSGYKVDFPWLDSVQAPDPATVIFKAKYAYADVPGSLVCRNYGHILAKEHEESPEAVNKLMGSGPFIFVDRQPPVINGRFKRNPDYWAKPWPYFDEVEVHGSADITKKIADFISHQVHVTRWFDEQARDELKRARPDALLFVNPYNAWAVNYRTDLPPFNDKRVRQAAAMLINRKQIMDGVYKGEGEDDQWFTWIIKTAMGNFRKPAELPGARFWKNDVQAAKQLLSAAGITAPLEMANLHWDASVVGQGYVDINTLIATQWRNAGFINSKDTPMTLAQSNSTTAIGNFEGWNVGGSNTGILDPGLGNAFRNALYSPPGGLQGPSPNNARINDPRINELVVKQIAQFNPQERRQTFREMEDIFSEEQYKIALNVFGTHWYADPALRGLQIPVTHAGNTAWAYEKYWWFKDGKTP